jgi:hypothetical protein
MGDKIKKNEMDGACSTDGGGERRVQDFVEILIPTGIQSVDHPTCNHSLYQLSYPSHALPNSQRKTRIQQKMSYLCITSSSSSPPPPIGPFFFFSSSYRPLLLLLLLL